LRNRMVVVVMFWICLSLIPADFEADPSRIWSELKKLDGESLWPGFYVGEYPLAVFISGETVLFGHPHPPAGFSPLPALPGAWRCAGRFPGVVSNSVAEIEGVVTATVAVGAGDGAGAAAIAAHEMFHIYAETKFPLWSASVMAAADYPKFSVDNLVGVGLERLALARALEAGTRPAAVSWIGAFLEIRSRRFASLDPEHREFESHNELHEGMAHYVEKKVLRREAATDELRTPPAPDQVRRWGYANGTAQAVLLDRFFPEWKLLLERWGYIPLEILLEMAVHSTTGRPNVFAPEEIAGVRRDSLAAIDRLKASFQAMREKYSQPDFWVLSLELIVPQGDFQLQYVDPMNMHMIGENEIIHTHSLRLGNGSGSLVLLNPRWQPGSDSGLTALTVSAGPWRVSAVTIAGFTEEPKVSAVEGTVNLQMDGLSLEFAGTEVRREGKKIRLLVGK